MAPVCNVTYAPIDSNDGFIGRDGTITWDWHHIGWAVAGASAAVSTIISFTNISRHALHYTDRDQQRNIIRILFMPVVYGNTSFLSYRYFHAYTYYALAETAYEGICIGAFLMLMCHMVHSLRTDDDDNVRLDLSEFLEETDKVRVPLTFGMLHMRPSKTYFLFTLKWSVLQHVVIRPGLTLVAIFCESQHILCPGEWHMQTAAVYLDIIDLISITIAMYGLLVWYELCKGILKGRMLLRKFSAIKAIVFLTFYTGWLLNLLRKKGLIHGTQFWTAQNVADGIAALFNCVLMLMASAYMLYAYPSAEYHDEAKHQKPGRFVLALWDAVNIFDLLIDLWRSMRYFTDKTRAKQSILGRAFSREKGKKLAKPVKAGTPPTAYGNIYEEEMQLKRNKEAGKMAEARAAAKRYGFPDGT